MNKRLATEEEIKEAFEAHVHRWDTMNPSFKKPEGYWESKMEEAIEEGYKSEKCECGATLLPFHHFVTCSRNGCPFRSDESIIDGIFGKDV